jgi:hypothetical protein
LKKKNKLGAFILSIIPGFGHIYLGFSTRGALFLGAFIIAPILMSFLTNFAGLWRFNSLIAVPMVVIWLASMLDALILTDRINGRANMENLPDSPGSIVPNYGIMLKQNKKVIAMLLSIIPGAGHLYIGLQRQGIELMAGFFLSFYLTDWLRLSIFLVLAPIIWFASMFDVMHKVSGDRLMDDSSIFSGKWFTDKDTMIGQKSFLRNKHKVIGYVLLTVGLYLILSRFVYAFIKPYLDSRITDNIQTGIVAILLIIGGIKFLLGGKTSETDNKTEQMS